MNTLRVALRLAATALARLTGHPRERRLSEDWQPTIDLGYVPPDD